MNERIRELAKQAYEDVIRNTPSFLVTKEMYEQKFAKLIIKECAGLLEKEAESNYDEGTEPYNLLRNGSKWIKQQFGVEE